MTLTRPVDRATGVLMDVLAVSIGMVLFALFAHQAAPAIAISAVSLLVVAATVGRSVRRVVRPAALFGLDAFPRRTVLSLFFGVVAGSAIAGVHRSGLGMTPWPTSGLEAFAVVACLIGAAEELLYRGWLLERVRELGWPAAVIIAAVAHAAYKTALFALPPGSAGIDHTGIMLGTTIGGIALGIWRVRTESVVPPMAAHAAFDLVVYGTLTDAPWWVWS